MVLYYALSQYLSGTESLDVWMGGWVERWWGHFVGPRLVPHVLGIHSARYSILHYFQYSMGTESLGGWVDGPPNNIYIYCLAPAGGRIRSQGTYCLPPAGVLHSQNKVINVSPTTSHKGGGQRYGFININDMYNNDVGKGEAQGCEAYEVK